MESEGNRAAAIVAEKRFLEILYQTPPLQIRKDPTERPTLAPRQVEAFINSVEIVTAWSGAATARRPVCKIFICRNPPTFQCELLR